MKKRAKILVAGSMNMDLIGTVSKFPEAGETIIGGEFRTAPGGKGANQAIQAARLGADVTFVGKVGDDDFGKTLVSLAEKSGVDTSRIAVDKNCSTGVAQIEVKTDENGTENRILVLPGANMKITVSETEFLKEEIKNYDMVILQLEIPMEINCAVARFAKDAGVPVMLNPAPSSKIPSELLECVTYISPNEHEAFDITGIAPDSDETLKLSVAKLRDMGVGNALITLGKNGCVFSDGDEVIYSPCVECEKVVDPTAAGDSFVAAFCVAVSYGVSIRDALKFANCVGSLTVSKMGAQTSLSTLDEVFEFMKIRKIDTTPFNNIK